MWLPLVLGCWHSPWYGGPKARSVDREDYDHDTDWSDDTDELGCGGDVAAYTADSVYELVQNALDDVDDGGTVTICQGTHNEALQVWDKSLLIRGQGDASEQILDGAGEHRILGITGGAEVKIRRLTFVGGHTDNAGGAIRVGDGASLVVRNSVFEENHADIGGAIGATSDAGLAVRIVQSVLTSNTASQHGGAIGFVCDGGDCTLSLEDSTLRANQAEDSGGAVRAAGTVGSTLELHGLDMEDNATDGSGGAIALGGAGARQLTAIGGFYTGNAASQGGVVASAAGGERNILFEDVDVYDNSATDGGVAALHGTGAHELVLVGGGFVANEADGGAGLVSTLDEVPTVVTVAHTELASNTSSKDAAAMVLADSTTLTSEKTDWGAGTTDNAPADVLAGGSVWSWDDQASFVCEAGVCE